MSRITNLFARSSIRKPVIDQTQLGDVGRLNETLVVRQAETDCGTKTADGFASLSEAQKDIKESFTRVFTDLSEVQNITERVRCLESNTVSLLDVHLDLALRHSSTCRQLEHANSDRQEQLILIEKLQSNLAELQQQQHTAAIQALELQTNLESMTHRNQTQAAANIELESQLAKVASELDEVQERAAGLSLEVAALSRQNSEDGVKIAELGTSLSEATERLAQSEHRCSAYELSHQVRVEEIANLKSQLETLSHEKDISIKIFQQKEKDALQARSDYSNLFEKSQSEYLRYESEISKLQSEFDNVTSLLKASTTVNSELKAEVDRLHSQVRHLDDLNRQMEIKNGLLESRVSRLTVNVDSLSSSKTNLEQSRSAMAARVEAVNDALHLRENTARRLEADLARVTAQNAEKVASLRDRIKFLEDKVTGLEDDLANSQNELSFYLPRAN